MTKIIIIIMMMMKIMMTMMMGLMVLLSIELNVIKCNNLKQELSNINVSVRKLLNNYCC